MRVKLYFLMTLLPLFFSCNNEEDNFNSFQELDNEQYSYYVAEALDAMNMPRPEGSYNYPCLPGMPSWKELNSGEEMNVACHVPDDVLNNQTTQAVIQAMWEHPKFKDPIGFSSNSSIQKSLNNVLLDWNIYLELTKRSDAASCLVERYNRMQPTKVSHTFYNNSLQLLLSQTIFLEQLSADEKLLLAKEMVERKASVEKVLEMENESSSLDSFYFCLVRIMVSCQYAPMMSWMENNEAIQQFEESGDIFFLSSEMRKDILDLSIDFINNN